MFIIDDLGPGYTETGTWSNSGLGGYWGSSRFHLAGNGGAIASWSLNDLTPGMYQIEATWPSNPNRTPFANYTIYDGVRVIGSAIIDQRRDPIGTFQFLGAFSISSGTINVVLSESPYGVVGADAIRISRVLLSPEEIAHEISNIWQSTVLTALQSVGFFNNQKSGIFSMSPSSRLDQLLRAEGIPISGVNINPTSGEIRIEYLAEATPEQRTAGSQIAARLDLRPKRSRKLGDIAVEVAGLPQQELLRLLVALISEKIQSDPFFAFDKGLALIGEELDPNPPPPIV